MWTQRSSTTDCGFFLLFAFMFMSSCIWWEVSACPSMCKCKEKIVSCQKGKWSDLVQGLSVELEQLILDDVSGLEIIRPITFLRYKDYLKMLKIKSCSVEIIVPSSFDDFDALEVLDLSENNDLQNLESDSFSGLVNLKSLILSKNRISSLEKILEPLTGLKTLDVTHNALQELSPSVFQNQSSLVSLSLSGNRLNHLKSQSFSGLHLVQELHLRDCSLKSIDLDIFTHLPKLILLDLGQNSLSKPLSKDILTYLPFLSTLLFDHNEIRRLEHKNFAGLHLELLDLSYNRIRYIEKTAFQNLTVKALDLSYTYNLNPSSSHLSSMNRVEKLEANVFSELGHLEHLNISFCSLEVLSKEMLDSMPLLKTLDISHNNLNSVSQEIIERLDGMTIVNLHKNRWICDCKIKPLSDWLKKPQISDKLYCPPSRSNFEDCAALQCTAPNQLQKQLLDQLTEDQLGKCSKPEDSNSLPGSTQGAIVAACLGFAIIFLIITVYLWRNGKTRFKLKRVCVPSEAESSHMIDEDSKVPPLSNCDRQSLTESDHEFVVRHYFDTLVTDPKLMSRTSDSEEPTSPKERDSMYSSQPSLYSTNAALGIESTV